jgi:hypothetical protein
MGGGGVRVLSSTSRITQERSATMLSTSRLELTNIIGRMPTHSAKIRVICKSGKRAGTIEALQCDRTAGAWRSGTRPGIFFAAAVSFRFLAPSKLTAELLQCQGLGARWPGARANSTGESL